MGPNRHNKRKQKKGCGCKLCKPHKGTWAPFHKEKFRAKMKAQLQEINSDW
jgi:hypothetical protein